MPVGIRRIWVIPWDTARGLFGVAYEYADGDSACDPVGTESEAQAVVDEIERKGKSAVGDNVVNLIEATSRRRSG